MRFDLLPELKEPFLLAYNFSQENELYYIDSQMILLGLLESSLDDLYIDDIDRDRICKWLRELNWEKRGDVNRGMSTPLTQEAKYVIENAVRYQKKLRDKKMKPGHIILALLSIQNLCQFKLHDLGINFTIYLKRLQDAAGTHYKVPFSHTRIKPSRAVPYNPVILWMYGAKQRKQMAEEHLAEARNFLQYYDRKRARRFSRYVLQLDGENTDARWIIALSFTADNQYAKAIPYYEKLVVKFPEHTGVLAQLGYCYNKTGNKERAIALFLRALAVNPSSAFLLNHLGFVLIDLQQYDRAITLFDQAIAIDPEFARAYSNKGYVLMRLGYLAQAREQITYAIELNKGNSYAYRNLALLYLQERNIPAAKEMLLKARLYNFREAHGSEVDDLIRSIN
jgi:tetratricopeptide (TPR) repeat protein